MPLLELLKQDCDLSDSKTLSLGKLYKIKYPRFYKSMYGNKKSLEINHRITFFVVTPNLEEKTIPEVEQEKKFKIEIKEFTENTHMIYVGCFRLADVFKFIKSPFLSRHIPCFLVGNKFLIPESFVANNGDMFFVSE